MAGWHLGEADLFNRERQFQAPKATKQTDLHMQHYMMSDLGLQPQSEEQQILYLTNVYIKGSV
ncbi:hypothetical protein BM221_002871 [Beauveria bassiana]|uniref:Uncharacterized protein n=1 Tax=Beauveria bassiana TaxID=176275 RepID=A0A2N6NT20_BEABA|nr:hypothetical protein BM221_002871 [Beauveria bassiana]